MAKQGLYVDGSWVATHADQTVDVINATSEEIIETVALGDGHDVDRAVKSANQAFAAWSATSRQERARLLHALADELAARQDVIATSIVDEVGTPMRTAQRIQAALPVTVLHGYAEALEAEESPEMIANTLVAREPVGVVAAIAPWNYPLHQVVAKLAPALAAGCVIVVKPSEVAPLTSYLLTEAIEAAGIPAGVVNIVQGTGPVVGEALAGHPDVDAVSFTGSVNAGSRVAQLAAPMVKRVTLELGGKSANVVLDDADLQTAVKVGVSNAFLNGGQTCTAWTRLVVPRARLGDALDLAKQYAEAFAPGDPRDPATKLGPLSSGPHRERVRSYIRKGIEEGADLVTGGADAPEGFERGFYVSPTVFGNVDPDATIAQEEIFGPVLSVIAHDGDDDAVRIANNSKYGLHGAVWSGEDDRALAVARRMRTGTVDVNGGPYNPLAPFGGYKQSGVGREMGPYGLDEYLEIKAIQLKGK